MFLPFKIICVFIIVPNLGCKIGVAMKNQSETEKMSSQDTGLQVEYYSEKFQTLLYQERKVFFILSSIPIHCNNNIKL